MPLLIEQDIESCIVSTRIEPNDKGGMELMASTSFPASFSGFQGHFPDQPVLPAIIQLATVRRLAEKAVQSPLAVIQYTRTKFKAMVAPEEKLHVKIQLEQSEKTVSGKFKITKEDNRQVAGGSFVFQSHAAKSEKL